jgi:hypothetical protein
MKALAQAWNSFLAFISSTVVWVLCITVPILISIVVGIVPIILMAIWEGVTAAPVGDTTFEMVVALVALLVTLALMPAISTAILRLSLRLSPLPIGIAGSSHVAPTLWLSWLLVLAALVASGSQWITPLVAVVVGACGMGRAYHFRYHWSGFPRGRTVLFLRRFGRTADRVVSTAIRRAMPQGTCLAFLVGSRQGAASWDPLVVGFDGIFRHALPHYLRSTDDDWVGHVRQMVLRADAVVLDATDWSEAMDTERAIIDTCGASDRLIVLRRQDGAVENALQARQQLRYRASWRQAGHRMYFGSMLTLVPAVVGDSVGWSLKARVLVTLPAVVAWLCLAVRPLMDADSADELTRRLITVSTLRSAEHERDTIVPEGSEE